MATYEVTFPIRDEQEILKLRAGDEVVVQGHIIGIRDRTQIRIFDQGVEPPMDLSGAFLLHTAPNVRKVGEGRYEKLCIGTTTSARSTASARSAARAASPTRRSSRCASTGWSTSRSSEARRRSRRPRSRRSRRSPGRS